MRGRPTASRGRPTINRTPKVNLTYNKTSKINDWQILPIFSSSSNPNLPYAQVYRNNKKRIDVTKQVFQDNNEIIVSTHKTGKPSTRSKEKRFKYNHEGIIKSEKYIKSLMDTKEK